MPPALQFSGFAPHPIKICLEPACDSEPQHFRHVVRMELGHGLSQGFPLAAARLEEHLDLGGLLDLSLPPIDRGDPVDDGAARDEAAVDQIADERARRRRRGERR